MHTNFCISSNRFIHFLKANLEDKLKCLDVEDVRINLHRKDLKKTSLLLCKLECGNDIYTQKKWRLVAANIIAGAVAENILGFWEHHIVGKIIYENYFYLNDEDLPVIKKSVLQRLKKDNNNHNYYKNKILHENLMYFRLVDFLSENNYLDMEGFISFRLKNYVGMLNDMVDEAVEEYLLEREYIEFVDLLRSLTGLNEIKKEEVHVVFKTESSVELLDEKFLPIRCDYLDNYFSGILNEDEIIYDDLLVCVLIAISPKRIVLHYKSEMHPAVLHTLKKVFPARVKECTDCF